MKEEIQKKIDFVIHSGYLLENRVFSDSQYNYMNVFSSDLYMKRAFMPFLRPQAQMALKALFAINIHSVRLTLDNFTANDNKTRGQ